MNANTKEIIAMLYRTGYKKVHCRRLPVVLTHSTLDNCFYLAQCAVLTGVTKIVTHSIFPFALLNDVMFKI